MTTIKEIAQKCGVSSSTVSNIINGKMNMGEETKNRVLEEVKKSGYQPNYFAQGMRKLKTKTIGIIVEELDNFSTPSMIEGIMKTCEDNGYRTILVNMRMYERWRNAWWDEKEVEYNSVLEMAIKEILFMKVDGIIYVAGHARIINCFPDYLKIPAVLAYGYSASDKYTSVVIDDEQGGYDMTKYLISKGHRKIGVISGCVDNIHSIKRYQGYQKALFQEKILCDPGLIRYGDWFRASGYKETGYLMKEGVTAIFCFNDIMTGGVYDYLEDHQLKAGKDVSVVGYDNQEFTVYFRPAVTTMEIPTKEIGSKAAEALLQLMDEKGNWEETETRKIEVPCKLIERNSVAELINEQ